MNTNISIGRYVPSDSILHSLDPRLKIFFAVFSIIVLFLLSNPVYLVVFYSFVFFISIISKLGISYIFKSIKSIWLLILMAFLFQVFRSNGKILIDAGIFTISDTSLINSVINVSRLVFLIIISTVFTGTTSPIKIADAVENILNFFRVPKNFSHELSLILTIAIRFIPVISDEAQNIADSQKSRGATLDNGRFLDRIKSLFPILIPLLINTIRRADDLALAMDVRCYSGYEGRTKFKKMKFTLNDYIGFAVLVLFFVILIMADKLWI